MDANTFRVRVSVTKATSRRRAHSAFLKQCSEVTLENGCDFFVILNYEDYIAIRDSENWASPSEVIRIFKGAVPPGVPGAFDARKTLAQEG